MTVFPTASYLVSWARWSPQVRQSAGKRTGSNATGRGNPYLGAALGEAAASAGRTQSFPGARYRRLTRRMPRKKALVATGSSMLTIIYALLADPDATYQDPGTVTQSPSALTRRRTLTHAQLGSYFRTRAWELKGKLKDGFGALLLALEGGPDCARLVRILDDAQFRGAEENFTEILRKFRDVLAARLRVLGPDHPSTLTTARWIDFLKQQNS